MIRVSKIVQAGLVVLSLLPIATAAGFGMGGPSVNVGVSSPMGSSGAMVNGNLSYGHGSPAATNPAVAAIEARQRDAQVAAEIEQARATGRSVAVADADRRKGDGAIESNHPDEAMLDFAQAERDLGIVAKTTAMGAYSQSATGSVAPAGTELSGAIVH